MLSNAKDLAFSVTYEAEILRLSPQDDIAAQSGPWGRRKAGLNNLNALTPHFFTHTSFALDLDARSGLFYRQNTLGISEINGVLITERRLLWDY